MDAHKKSTVAVDESTVNGEPTANEVDLTKWRLDQNFVELAGVKKLLTTVPVRKPHKQEFVRVHPDAAFRMDCAIIELDEDRENYLVMPSIAAAVVNEVKPTRLCTTITRQGTVFLWPVPLTPSDAKVLEAHRSHQEAAERAVGRWIRMVWSKPLGAYEITGSPDRADPVWPEHSFQKLLEVGFRDRIIQSLDHPVLKRLRGEC
jgi:hypothetical protein